ncbi:MAG: ABC transporter substrate-binding protein [Clostridium sp.]|uniref:ABC transporter substrate-binding protein n=1 Tax=Clostridium sp. TaxID=1506 RepID=UPI00306F5C2A
MKNMRKLLTLLLSAMLIFSLVGCGNKDKGASTPNNDNTSQQNESTNSHYPVTIKTYNYAKEPIEITFNKAPEKVFAIYQNSIETLLALGLSDKIVAASGLDHDVKPEFQNDFNKINYLEEFTPSKESVIMTQPDFILGWYSLFDEKRLGEVNYWHNNKINTYMSLNSGVIKEKTIENEITDILNLGKIFNVEEKAKALVNEINNGVKTASHAVKDKEKQTTLIVELGSDKIRSYGANTLGGDMVTKLGATLLNEAGTALGKEDLINLNPDSIFVVYMDRGDENIPITKVNEILEDESLKSLSAVTNKRVYAIPLGDMYSSGIRTIDGINTFSEGLYGNLEK